VVVIATTIVFIFYKIFLLPEVFGYI